MKDATKLVHAYLMGRKIGALHFQDAIRNVIVKYFRGDQQPSSVFAYWVYTECLSKDCCGLKKLVVDYCVWHKRLHPEGTVPLSKFPLEFVVDAGAAMKAFETEVPIEPNNLHERIESIRVCNDFTTSKKFCATRVAVVLSAITITTLRTSYVFT